MKKKNKEKYVKVCPRCGSTNITPNTFRYHGFGVEEYRDNCKDCGYEGFVPEVREDEVNNFRHDLEKNKEK